MHKSVIAQVCLLRVMQIYLCMHGEKTKIGRCTHILMEYLFPSIHPSVHFLPLIQVTVTRAAVLKEKPRFPSPQPPLPGHPMGQWIEPKPAKRWNLSSESWVCSGAWCPEHIPQKMSSRHANQFHSFSHYSKLMKTGEGMNSMTLGLICRDVHFWDDCRIVLTHI